MDGAGCRAPRLHHPGLREARADARRSAGARPASANGRTGRSRRRQDVGGAHGRHPGGPIRRPDLQLRRARAAFGQSDRNENPADQLRPDMGHLLRGAPAWNLRLQ